MKALIQSYQKEIKRIKDRGTVYMKLHSGKWYRTYNKDIVKLKISILEDTINEKVNYIKELSK